VRTLLLSERVTTAPALGAAAEIVTVQVDAADVARVVGVHVKDVGVVGGRFAAAEIVPPVPERASAVPEGSTADVFVTVMAVLLTLEAIVTLTTATTPFAIVFAFIPVARHV
jgi:hypothetical protein